MAGWDPGPDGPANDNQAEAERWCREARAAARLAWSILGLWVVALVLLLVLR